MRWTQTKARILSIVIACTGASSALWAGECTTRVLLEQKKDVATINRLERAWSAAYVQGDTDFERCLLTPDFSQILRDGRTTGLAEELQFAAANRGKHLPVAQFPPETILIHGDVAVAYGKVALRNAGTLHQSMWFADYYVWENDKWHSYFAQQTLIEGGSRR